MADDDDALRMLVISWLKQAGLQCVEAVNGEDALAKVTELAPRLDAIVCDVMMPGLDGFEVLTRLRHVPETSGIPVVLLTAHATGETDLVRGAEAGAVDQLSKPFSGPVLVAKVRGLCERSRLERHMRNKLRFAEEYATIDYLTGLFNRRHLDVTLKAETSHSCRHRRPLAVVMFDLDNFKSVNDSYGHEEGDRVLRHVADAVRTVVRNEDMAFRYGGEEFVLLLRTCNATGAVAVAERLRAELRGRPIDLGPARMTRLITLSGGIASMEEVNGYRGDELIARADAALYRAKKSGRDRIEFEAEHKA